MSNPIIDIVFITFIVQTLYYYIRRKLGDKDKFTITKEQSKYIISGYITLFLHTLVIYIFYLTDLLIVILFAIPLVLYFFYIFYKLYGSPLMLIQNRFKFRKV